MPEPLEQSRRGAIRRWLRVAGQLVWQSALPIAFALAYTAWDRHTSKQATPRTFSQDIKTFAGSLFFLMWLSGQLLRVRKQMQDEESFGKLRDEVREVREVLRAIHDGWLGRAEPTPPATPPAGPPPAGPPPAGPATVGRVPVGVTPAARPTPKPPESGMRDEVARALVHDSARALDAGSIHSALLTLAVAFEHAVRQAARAVDVDEAEQAPVPRLLSYLKRPLGDAATRMNVFWRARNMLVHRAAGWALSDADARELADGYLWAIRLLDQVANR